MSKTLSAETTHPCVTDGSDLANLAAGHSVPFKEAGTELFSRCTALTATPTATPTPTRSKAPTPTPTPTGHPARVVKYVIESDGSIESITYSNTVDGSSGQEQATGPMRGKVEKSYTFPGEFGGRYDVTIFGVTAMAGADASTISCNIIINGNVLKEQTSTGAYSHVSCFS